MTKTLMRNDALLEGEEVLGVFGSEAWYSHSRLLIRTMCCCCSEIDQIEA